MVVSAVAQEMPPSLVPFAPRALSMALVSRSIGAGAAAGVAGGVPVASSAALRPRAIWGVTAFAVEVRPPHRWGLLEQVLVQRSLGDPVLLERVGDFRQFPPR